MRKCRWSFPIQNSALGSPKPYLKQRANINTPYFDSSSKHLIQVWNEQTNPLKTARFEVTKYNLTIVSHQNHYSYQTISALSTGSFTLYMHLSWFLNIIYSTLCILQHFGMLCLSHKTSKIDFEQKNLLVVIPISGKTRVSVHASLQNCPGCIIVLKVARKSHRGRTALSVEKVDAARGVGVG